MVDVALNHPEFVGPQPGERVGLAQGGQQAGARVAQQQIACGGAQGLVDRREVDQIEAEERGAAVAPPPALEDVPQPRKERVVIEQPGQRIVARRSLGLAVQGAGGAQAGRGAVDGRPLAQISAAVLPVIASASTPNRAVRSPVELATNGMLAPSNTPTLAIRLLSNSLTIRRCGDHTQSFRPRANPRAAQIGRARLMQR